MKLRIAAISSLLVAWAACAPAGAQAAVCTPPASGVATTTTTPVTTTTTTGTTTTGTTTTPTTTTPTTTTPVTTPTAPVNPTQMSLKLGGLFTVQGAHVTVPKRVVALTVAVTPFVSGQQLVVKEALNGRVFKTVEPVAGCVAGGDTGRFTLKVVSPGAGRVTVTVRHAANPVMGAVALRGSFTALNTNVRPGSTGRFVVLIQRQLSALHLYIPQTGVYDLGTQLAVDAYHRVLGDGEGITTFNSKTLAQLLDGKGSFHVRYPGQGQHAEGDLSDQVLAFTNGSKVHWLFPISSGKPSTPTVLGEFQVYYKEPEYTSDGMYFSSFFHGGYAIHGYNPAPDYPASHGCMRLPMVDAIPAYGWIQMGDWVDTYYT